MMFGIFNSGILATGPAAGARYDYGAAPAEVMAKVVELQRRAEAAGVSLAAAALRFAMTHPAAASVLIGTASPRSLAHNLDAAEAPWPARADAIFIGLPTVEGVRRRERRDE